jgi:hypothetical protein
LCLSRLDETVNDAQLIIECVSEDFDVKSLLLEKISTLCPIDCIITTTTLRLDIAKLSDKVKNKERFTGLRFLYPVYYISEVEFTPHKDTNNWIIERLRMLLGEMGKTLFFRSTTDNPLILSEEKREMRRQQRIEELRINGGLPIIMSFRQNDYGNLPELNSRMNTISSSIDQNQQRNLLRQQQLAQQQQQQQRQQNDFFSFNNNINVLKSVTKSKWSSKSSSLDKKNQNQQQHNDDGPNIDNDCAICMDMFRNSVLRPCNHMITCYDCSKLLLNRQDCCPVCRELITEVIKIFMS